MSKQRIDEMKKFMQIAEGNVAEAKKVDPKLKKAARLMKDVADALHAEYEERMNAAGDDAEEIEFAGYALDDAKDYEKLVKMLLAGRGKQAANFYDGLDTVAREYIYDHLEEDELEYLGQVFGALGSSWLYADDEDADDGEWDDDPMDSATRRLFGYDPLGESDPDDTDWDAHWAREDGDEERADDLEWDAEWERMDEEKCEKCGREGCECGPDCDCEPLEEGVVLETAVLLGFLGFALWKGVPKVIEHFKKKRVADVIADFEKNVNPQTIENFKNKFVARLKSTAPQSRKALMHRIELVEKLLMHIPEKANDSSVSMEIHLDKLQRAMSDVDKFVRKSNVGVMQRKSDKKRRAAKEDIHLDSIVESVLSEDSYADYVDWEDEPGQDEPMTKGKSQVVKDVADELGLEVEDMPLVDPDEDDQLGLRFD